MKDTVVINDKNVEVEVTAYTMLIYEDTFKGHSFCVMPTVFLSRISMM